MRAKMKWSNGIVLALILVLCTTVFAAASYAAVAGPGFLAQDGLADFTPLDIESDPPNPRAWDFLHYTSRVENQGSAAAELCVWYYIDDARVTGEAEHWGHVDPGYWRDVDFQHSGLPEGWHSVRFVVDPQDAVPESNEENNEI